MQDSVCKCRVSPPAVATDRSGPRGARTMEVVNERCAGLDVHKKVVVACVLTPDEVGADEQPTPVLRRFGTMTDDLVGLARWLAERGVVRVAMESTGVYWQPV